MEEEEIRRAKIPGEQKQDNETRQQKRGGERKTYHCEEKMTPAIIKLLTKSYKGKVKKENVVGAQREESSHSSSAWRGPRPAPCEAPQARRARPAGEGMQETGVQEEEVRYCFNSENQIVRYC
jgi:hypothetical protein